MYVTRIVWTPYGWQVVPVWVGALPLTPWAIASYPGYGYGYQPTYGYGGVPVWTAPGQAVSVHYNTP